jgi:hypothetical protein
MFRASSIPAFARETRLDPRLEFGGPDWAQHIPSAIGKSKLWKVLDELFD